MKGFLYFSVKIDNCNAIIVKIIVYILNAKISIFVFLNKQSHSKYFLLRIWHESSNNFYFLYKGGAYWAGSVNFDIYGTRFFHKQSIFERPPKNCLSFSKKLPQKIV